MLVSLRRSNFPCNNSFSLYICKKKLLSDKYIEVPPNKPLNTKTSLPGNILPEILFYKKNTTYY